MTLKERVNNDLMYSNYAAHARMQLTWSARSLGQLEYRSSRLHLSRVPMLESATEKKAGLPCWLLPQIKDVRHVRLL